MNEQLIDRLYKVVETIIPVKNIVDIFVQFTKEFYSFTYKILKAIFYKLEPILSNPGTMDTSNRFLYGIATYLKGTNIPFLGTGINLQLIAKFLVGIWLLRNAVKIIKYFLIAVFSSVFINNLIDGKASNIVPREDNQDQAIQQIVANKDKPINLMEDQACNK